MAISHLTIRKCLLFSIWNLDISYRKENKHLALMYVILSFGMLFHYGIGLPDLCNTTALNSRTMQGRAITTDNLLDLDKGGLGLLDKAVAFYFNLALQIVTHHTIFLLQSALSCFAVHHTLQGFSRPLIMGVPTLETRCANIFSLAG